MRKAAKRARAFSKQPSQRRDSTRGARKRVKKVRSLLGDHQDTVLARPVLRQLGAQAQVEGGNAFIFGALHAAEHATARALEQQLPAAWERVEQARRT
jgi:CHAD domain-containing protein